MGFKNSTFPLAVYGAIDTASRKLLRLKVWVANSNPIIVGRWYLEYLYECRTMPSILRLDKGTETGIITTMHAFLRQSHGDMDPCDTDIWSFNTKPGTSLKMLIGFSANIACSRHSNNSRRLGGIDFCQKMIISIPSPLLYACLS